MFRSKRAVVVGDRHQLRHVSKLNESKNNFLLEKYKLTNLEDNIYSYKDVSLYDFFQNSKSISTHFLRDTFRSINEIANYSNELCYNGMLRVATNEDDIINKLPKTLKMGSNGRILKVKLECGST